MYGIGSLSTGGTLSLRAMGGIGVAYSSPYEYNYANPASLGSISQQSAIFNFSMVSSNYYETSQVTSTSYNSVDFAELGFAIPLAKGVGLGVSLTPYSSVGYNTLLIEEDQDILEEVGGTAYTYYGDGGISQLTASIGVNVFRGLNLGVSMHYNFGSINRVWKSTIYNVLNANEYRGVYTNDYLSINQLSWSVGAQYKARIGDDDHISLGVNYTPASSADMDRSVLATTSSSTLLDTVSNDVEVLEATFPEKLTAGIYYSNNKFGVGFDYSRQDWRESFETPSNVSLCLVNDYRFGLKYTPDRYSVRSFLARLTYKAGFRYASSYLAMDNQEMDEWAVTLGFDMPLKMRNYSSFNFGLEYAKLGSASATINETYFKVYLGVSIFAGDDMWFIRRKLN